MTTKMIEFTTVQGVTVHLMVDKIVAIYGVPNTDNVGVYTLPGLEYTVKATLDEVVNWVARG